MRKLNLMTLFSLLILSLQSVNGSAGVTNGSAAPDFELTGYPIKTQLAKQNGKYVVLEWFNEGCPFVRRHYDSKKMQNLQNKYKDKVSWLTINSSAKGKQGFLKDVSIASNTYTKEQMGALALLLDSNGKVGRMYAAKTTPHMFVIGPAGRVVYQGAIDNDNYGDKKDKEIINYVDEVLKASLNGSKLTVMTKTEPYGCSVKYN